MLIITIIGVVFSFIGSLSCLFLDDFEGNPNISVAIKSGSTVPGMMDACVWKCRKIMSMMWYRVPSQLRRGSKQVRSGVSKTNNSSTASKDVFGLSISPQVHNITRGVSDTKSTHRFGSLDLLASVNGQPKAREL